MTEEELEAIEKRANSNELTGALSADIETLIAEIRKLKEEIDAAQPKLALLHRLMPKLKC